MNQDRAVIIVGVTLAVIYTGVCIASTILTFMMAGSWLAQQSIEIKILGLIPLIVNLIFSGAGAIYLTRKIWEDEE